MNFKILMALAALICLAGILLRLNTWFSQSIHPSGPTIPTGQRLSTGIKAVISTLLSAKLFTLIQSAFADLLLQRRIIVKSGLRWSAHTLIFFGFILLLFMHGFESLISENLFSNYYPTLNPYLFLRNLFGVMVLAGVALAVYRRVTLKPKRLQSNSSDWIALVLVGGIMLSGMLLEGARISSETVFNEMNDEWGAFEGEELADLRAYWIAENGLVIRNLDGPITQEQVNRGLEVHESSCMECHASNKSAFASTGAAIFVRPFASVLGDSAAVTLFTLLHVLFCCALLGWLPFSKMFHIVSAPISLLINSVMGLESDTKENLLNRQMIGLSACTHCGSCSVECSSQMFFESFNNEFILPSEKIQFLKNIAAGKEVDKATRKKLQEGLIVCTSCDRCSTICPSGINLRDIFIASRYALLEDGQPEKTLLSHFSFPLALAQRFTGNHLQAVKMVEQQFSKLFEKLSSLPLPLTLGSSVEKENQSYQSCYSCQRCTNICPVVRSYDDPVASLDMLPHQLISSLGMGQKELAMGSQMIWSCSTCYLCQEHCPNQVELTDIFYKLKNGALTKIDSGEN